MADDAIDLRKAKPGWTVRTHAEAVLQVRKQHITFNPYEDKIETIFLTFSDYPDSACYNLNGEVVGARRPHPLDIVELIPPPRTEAEMAAALAEIARIAGGCVFGTSWPHAELSKILALAEGTQAPCSTSE